MQILSREGNLYVRFMKHFANDFWNSIDTLSFGQLLIGIVLWNLRAKSLHLPSVVSKYLNMSNAMPISTDMFVRSDESLEDLNTAGPACFALGVDFSYFRLLLLSIQFTGISDPKFI